MIARGSQNILPMVLRKFVICELKNMNIDGLSAFCQTRKYMNIFLACACYKSRSLLSFASFTTSTHYSKNK